MINSVIGLLRSIKTLAVTSFLSEWVWIFSAMDFSAFLVEVSKRKPNRGAQKTLCCSRKWFSLLFIDFSIILPMFDKREIGPWLLQDNVEPFLNTGITLADFNKLGKILFSRKLQMIVERRIKISFIIFFRI